MLVEHLGLLHISTGALLRNAAKEGTELGLRAKSIIDKGELISDDIMSGIVEERLSQDDVANGFILDGFPRNLAQARVLDEILDRLQRPVDEVIQIDINPELIIERIARRAREEGRADDTEATVRHRMEIYEEQTAPVADYYAKRGLLTRVLGEGKKEEILQRILALLKVNSAHA